MRNLVLLALLVMLTACAGGRYNASYPACQKLAQEQAKVFRWIAAHHRRVDAHFSGHYDPEVTRMFVRRRELYLERRDARCI